MKVTELHRYPVKSLGGQSVNSLIPKARGFQDDRRWMFTDASGRFISQRSHVQLAQFSAEAAGDVLTFRKIATGEVVGEVAGARQGGKKSKVVVWDDTFAATEIAGAKALRDLTRQLGILDARLFYMAPEDDRPVDPNYATAEERVSFADGFPYLITTTASLQDLSTKLGTGGLAQSRFRPNIVVATASPWEEDQWTGLAIGEHKFRTPKPCGRCIMITHEPGTGKRDLSVLTALAGYRKVGGKILFGMNACWEGGKGLVSVGDEVVIS